MVRASGRGATVIGIGSLGIAVASNFSDSMETVGFDYAQGGKRSYNVDTLLQIKNFDGSYSSKMDEIFKNERTTLLEYVSGKLVFIIMQSEGRFQEALVRPLLNFEKSIGAFTALFIIVPIGADRKREMDKVRSISQELDMVEFVDSEQLLSQYDSEKAVDMNNIYYSYIREKIRGINTIAENAISLGISLHDIKMFTALYGPLKLFTFRYSFINFSIAERDFFQAVGGINRDKIKRIYMFLEIGDEVDSTDLITFTRKIRNRLSGVDFRQGFIHTNQGFGIIVLVFSSP